MKLKNLIALATLAGSCLTAVAAPIALSPDPTAPGTFTGSFSQMVDGLFVDEYDFSPTTFSGLISFVLTGVGGNVNFFVATVNDQSFSTGPDGGPFTSFSFQAQVTADAPLRLSVFGANLDADGNPGGQGSYFGTVSAVSDVAAVPEPASFALILAGLVGLGLTTRRSRSSV